MTGRRWLRAKSDTQWVLAVTDVTTGIEAVPTIAAKLTQSGSTVSVDTTGSFSTNGTIASTQIDFGDGSSALAIAAAHTYTTPGSYTITVSLTDSTGKSATRLLKATVSASGTPNRAPTARLVSSVTNNVVTLDASGSTDPDGTIGLYVFSFGDNSASFSSSTPMTTHTYTTDGAYTATVTVTDNGGSTATSSTTFTATAPKPIAVGDTGGTGAQQTGTGVTLAQNLSGSTFSDLVNAAGTAATVSLQAKTYTFSDFAIIASGSVPTQFRYGAQVKVAKLLGAGSLYTTLSMVANSSTASSDVPAQGTGSSNQLQYVTLLGAGAGSTVTVDGLRILGTNQGHLYNGLRFEQIANPTLTNCTIVHIPGNAGSPPGETFGVNFQRATGTATVTNVTVDGQSVGAAAIGSNSSSAHFIVQGYYAKDNVYSAGWASWQQTGQMDFYNFTVDNCARGFNAERLAAIVNFWDPMWDAPLAGHFDVNPTYDGGYSGGVINFRFTAQSNFDAWFAKHGGNKISAVTNPTSVSNGLVKATTVNVYIAGVLQTQSNYVTWTGA